MRLINQLCRAYRKYETRQQLKNLSVEQLADIGKNQEQVKQELLKSGLKYPLKKVVKLPWKEAFFGKTINRLSRSAR
jgi:uncharacterized protein YjiS (DUF1127 family)